LRLYEATGMGALLLTDWKDDLGDIFETDREVVTYRSPEECAEKARYYLDHPDERAAIAEAGQRRTLRDHTWLKRMEEFVGIVERHLP
jgi:spore maturation protein CgeB